MAIVLAQLVDDIKLMIKSSQQKYLKRNIDLNDIPTDDLDVLCNYLPVQLVSELFGGHYQVLLKAHKGRMKEKKAAKQQQERMDEANRDENFEPKHPAGIGNWQYAERLKHKVFRSLESVLNQGVGTSGHSQFVQAAKALLTETEKTKEDAAEVMMAYENQLLILSEHLVEIFLPKLGSVLKKELKRSRDDVIKSISEIAKPDKYSLSMWKAEISRVVRAYDLKRFELILAETMANNQRVSEAFDFSKDLIENYKQTSEVMIESKHSAVLKNHIGSR